MLHLLLALALSTVAENGKPGTPDWEIMSPADAREIEGYASKTSVNGGEPIDLFVSTIAARYTIDIYRMGWYGGSGARRVAGPIERAGIVQDVPMPDPVTGLAECRWRDPYRLDTRDANGPWTSGVYLARLTALADPGRPQPTQSFIVFVVRDDARGAPVVFQSSVTTFAAYNNWGGKSLYAFNSAGGPARKVSFDRPYASNPYGVRLDGAGDFLRRWEYNAVRFLEREGYDITYVTDVDTHQREIPRGARIFLVVGHDEYWSWPMRLHIEAARDRGVHLGFLGGGASYWQNRFEPGSSGDVDRTIVSYKESAGDLDPFALDRDPQNNRQITGRWRDRPISRPEERIVGVMHSADPVDADIVVDNASHWVFGGTGLENGDRLRGLLGYIADTSYGGGPPTLERLAHSPYGPPSAPSRYADMTIYTSESGALVFAAGSTQWSWGLDGYNAPAWHTLRVGEPVQRITRNVLDRMQQGRTSAPKQSRSGRNPIVAIAAIMAAAYVLRAWLNRPRPDDELGSG
jgi:N,N-dimethylformamidase beta subunit-like, C-terminal